MTTSQDITTVRVERFEPSRTQEWDTFVCAHSRNGGIFQEQRFLGYHPEGRFVDESLLLYLDDELRGVLPAAIHPQDDKRIAAHPGSSAGMLVYHLRATTREVLALLEAALLHYKERGFRSIEFRMPEGFFTYPSAGELDFLLWHRNFRLKSREVSSSVNLDTEDNWLHMGRKKNPNSIRAARKKGVVIERVPTAQEPYSLIEQNLSQRHSKKPTHSLKELEQLKKLYPDRLDFWVARYESECIATVVTLRVTERAVHDFYIAQDYSHAKLNVFPSLFYEMFQFYKDNGFDWFNFGISSRGDWIKWGILEFKERMGGRATYRDVWELLELQDYEPYEDTYAGQV